MEDRIPRPIYTPKYSRDELHQMLDYILRRGGQWLIEKHFDGWIWYFSEPELPAEEPGQIVPFTKK